ncbi:MAG TPA: hypothetical protein VEI08_02760 [Candidatus Bathyarchaeia archaeon]|nr:hypothetical protein [Candidatus Bathyarchaeia archaeon]
MTEEGVLYDLLTGEMYVVEQIVPAALPDIPHPIMCTRSTGILAAELLSKLRKRNNYTPTDTNLPLDDVTFFKNDAQREEVLGL